MSWRDSLAPLRARTFRWYFAARAVDLLGDMMGMVALPFVVLAVTDSPGALGLVLAAQSIPMVVFLLLGGVLADRFGRTAVIQVSNVIAGASNLTMATLVLTGVAQVWHLVALAVVNGLAAAANQPALASVLPQLVPRDDLQSANSLNSLLQSAGLVVAPALGGVLVVAVGPGWAVAANGVTYLVAVALLAPIRLPARVDGQRSGIIDDLRSGWRVVSTTPWLAVVIPAFGILNALRAGGFNTLGPVLAIESSIGEQGWGLIVSAGGLGLVVMGLVLLRVELRRPLLWGMLSVTCFGLPMVALGTTTNLWAVLAASLLGGLGVQVFGIGWSLAMQEHVPGHLLGRVYSYDMLGSYAAIPIGQLTFGPLGAQFGVQRMIMLSGVVFVAVSVLTLLSRSVRQLRRAGPDPGPHEVATA